MTATSFAGRNPTNHVRSILYGLLAMHCSLGVDKKESSFNTPITSINTRYMSVKLHTFTCQRLYRYLPQALGHTKPRSIDAPYQEI